ICDSSSTLRAPAGAWKRAFARRWAVRRQLSAVERQTPEETHVAVTKSEVLKYARTIKKERPKVTEKELRAFLRSKFIDGVDGQAVARAMGVTAGLINDPIDWLKGLLRIARGVRRLWKHRDLKGIEEIIEGVIIIVEDGPSE